MDANTLKDLFEKSQNENPEKLQFSQDESTKFQKAFDDPEFRKLFSNYIDELQDPKNREENEAYITQLEGEKKVPEGKELIRPEPVFVAKTHKVVKETSDGKLDKLFINVVQSIKIAVPSKTTTAEGNCWSVPYSLGPPHMEKDKEGVNAPCFDCCFHPEALELGHRHKEFRDLLVHTAMEGVEQMYKTTQNQIVTLSRVFRVVKGLQYKQGQVPTMMIPLAGKEKWNHQQQQQQQLNTPDSSPSPSKGPSTGSRATSVTATSNLNNEQVSVQKPPASAPQPAIKKGFLNNSKTTLYPEKHIPTIRGSKSASSSSRSGGGGSSNVLLRDPSSSHEGHGFDIPAAAPDGPSSGPRLIQEIAAGTTVTNNSARTVVAAAVPPPAVVPELMKPVSTVKRSLLNVSKMPLKDKSAPTPTVMSQTGGAAISPQYSLKERGSVGMGDFEAMRSSHAASTRPDELVYRIELPLATKASLVVLDVAPRQLSLSYLDVYSLSVSLPYPVHDTRGTAKYDKASKSLTVTLPVVQQPSATLATSRNQAATVTDEAEIVPPLLESSKRAADSDVSKAPAVDKSHSRWVSPAVTSSESGLLLQEMQARAQKAVEEASASAAVLTHKTNTGGSLSTSSDFSSSGASPSPSPSSESDFSPSIVFRGRREGYVFRNGDAGVGYYADKQLKRQAPPPHSSAPECAPASATIITKDSNSHKADSVSALREARVFSMTAQQTRSAVALLVNVARILTDSVRIAFHKHAVDISFRALATDGAALAPVAVQYGLRLTLVEERCPGGLDVSRCTFDVAAGNMAVVLTKNGDAALWQEERGEEEMGALSLFHLGPCQLPEIDTERTKTVPEPHVDSLSPSVVVGSASKASASNLLLAAMSKMQFSSADSMLYDLD